MDIRLPIDDEIDTCPILEITSDLPWDPTYVSGDNFVPGAASSLIVREPSNDDPIHQLLNMRRLHGDFSYPIYDPVYNSMDAFVLNHLDSSIAVSSNFSNIDTVYDLERTIKSMSKNVCLNRVDRPPDLNKAQRCMGWFSRTLIEATTQHAKMTALPYRNHFKLRNPVLNRQCLYEAYATDT